MKIRLNKYEIIVIIISTILFAFGVVTWASFSTIYNKSVISNLLFSQNNDLSLGYSTWMMAHPPMKNVMKFYFFNLSNPDEVAYYGAPPALVEVGPFGVLESEEKKYLKWSDDKNKVFYQNYKKYLLSTDDSCPSCNWNDDILFANPTGLGAVASMIDPKFKITKAGRLIISTYLLLSGEYPFVSHGVREVLFDGYNDPLLSIAHSGLVKLLSGLLKGDDHSLIPIPIPQMPKFGYFQGYNNSRDEEYWINTGKEDINKLGSIDTWGGKKSLPEDWWTTDAARSINGTDSGSFSMMNLDEKSKIEFFMSFACRSFVKTFYDKKTIESIPANGYHVDRDQWDTTQLKNVGFRYRNIEKRNYYQNWPNCPKKTECKVKDVDCSNPDNFCNSCCNGSLYNGTYLLPPGMFPLVCYPGRLQPAPFSVVYSPPHFLFSPDEVRQSVIGMKPKNDSHEPMIYYHEPFSGTVLEVINRLQINMPIINSMASITSSNLPNVIIPLFWQESHAVLHSFMYNKLWMGFVLVPKLITTLQYLAIGLALFFIVLLLFFKLRRKSTPEKKIELSFDSEAADAEKL